MKNLLKKTIGFLILLSLLLSLAPLALATASYSAGCEGVTKKVAGDKMIEGGGDSYIISELNEPISAFDEILNDGSVTLSKVFLKFKKSGTTEWLYADSSCSCPSDSEYCTYVQLVVSQSGTGLLKTYIAIIYRWAAGIVGIICVLVIVISGIQISMDQGSGESVGSAKNRIMQSLAGLVILFLSALILYTVNPTFFTK